MCDTQKKRNENAVILAQELCATAPSGPEQQKMLRKWVDEANTGKEEDGKRIFLRNIEYEDKIRAPTFEIMYVKKGGLRANCDTNAEIPVHGSTRSAHCPVSSPSD